MPRKAKPPAKPKRGSKIIAPGDVGIIYTRYSSHNQRDVSIEQQIKEGMAYAQELGIPIVETYADRAVSGKTDKRKDFQRMMRDAAKGKFQYVIAWKSNRIGRNMLEAMINEAKLEDMGIRVLYIEEDFDDSAAGRFAARSMLNVNQFYSENMAEDIRRGMYDNAAKCMITNGGLPFGYKKGEDKRYAIDEPKDAIVREIFTRVACGEPFVDIASDLNARGIKTSAGNAWNKGSFHRMLANERYRGIYIYGDIRIDGGVPRIVSDELFFKAQEVLKMRKGVKGRHSVNGDYLLTGKLFCGRCNSYMTGISGTGRHGTTHYYYICQKRRNEKTCDKEMVRRDLLELTVAKAIRDYVLQDEIIECIADSTVEYNKRQEALSTVGILEDQLSEVKKSIKNLMSAIEMGIITDTTKSRLLELENEQAKLSAKISGERANIISVSKEHIIAWLETFREGDVNDKKYQAKLFNTFLISVHVFDNDLRIQFNFTGNNNALTVPLDASVIANFDADGGFGPLSKVPSAPPYGYYANPYYFFGGIAIKVPFDRNANKKKKPSS